MIHFDFIVDEIDASNIIDCIHSEHVRMLELALDLKVRNNNIDLSKITRKSGKEMYERKVAEEKWYREHAAYLKELMTKMTNKKVEK